MYWRITSSLGMLFSNCDSETLRQHTYEYKIGRLVDCHLTPPYVGTYGACGIGTSMDFCRLLLEPEAQPEQADLGARSHPGTSMHNRTEH